MDATFVLWEAEDVLRVPASAVFQEAGQDQVFRAVEGRAERTPVTTGRSNGLDTVILDGLAEGDRVVRHPDSQLDAGVRIQER